MTRLRSDIAELFKDNAPFLSNKVGLDIVLSCVTHTPTHTRVHDKLIL